MEWNSKYFFGHELTNADLRMERISYNTLSKAFPCILNNNIIGLDTEWCLVNGRDYDIGRDEYVEIFQYYIINKSGAEILKEFLPDEIVYYSPEYDLYLWGITHFGTSWTIVPTEIRINLKEGKNE